MLFLFGCSTLPPYSSYSTTLHRVNWNGEELQLRFEQGKITDLHDLNPEHSLDYDGYWIAPAFIDSHVHLAYLPVAEAMLDGGISAVVDLAAPIGFLESDLSPLQLKQAGPMVTATLGYPTQGWGSNGYGSECSNITCIDQTINTHYSLGARVVKLPLTNEPTLNDAQVIQAVQTAKNLGIPTVAHALSNSQALRAGTLGIDALAHTPTAPCTSETLSLWEDKYVISTLNAFGSTSAISNLQQMHQSGARVLYGTDLGNAQETGVSLSELNLLQQAGLSNEEIILSGTTLPADFWGFSDLGRIEVGYRASFLILDANPQDDITTLSRPVEVWIDGVKR